MSAPRNAAGATVGVARPTARVNRVVLPTPFGPTSAATCRSGMASVHWRSAQVGPPEAGVEPELDGRRRAAAHSSRRGVRPPDGPAGRGGCRWRATGARLVAGPPVGTRFAGVELDTLRYEEADGVATVTLDRPEVHNAFNETMQAELRQTWRALKTNDNVRAIVLTGAGERAFCTGIDRGDVRHEDDRYDFHPFTYEDPGRTIGPRSQGLWKPVIAAVNGMACGGAFYLLGQADFIVAADHATFFDPHVTYGMPAVFEPALMSARMPFGEVMRMTLMGTAERITAERAERIGLVTQVVPGSELLDTTRRLASTIASYSPSAVQASVRAVWASREVLPGQMIELGNLMLNVAMSAEALRSGQETFLNRPSEPPTLRS